MERVLIAYYSFEGHTEKVAEEIASRIRENGGEAELLKIRVAKEPPHKGFGKFMVGGFMALSQKDPGILNEEFNLGGYDRIFLGMPVWAGNAPGAIAAFIRKAKPEGKVFYLFAVSGSGEDKKTLSRTTDNLRGNRVVKTISLRAGAPLDVLDAFVTASDATAVTSDKSTKSSVSKELMDDVQNYIDANYQEVSTYELPNIESDAADYAAMSEMAAPREASYKQVREGFSFHVGHASHKDSFVGAAPMSFELDEGFSELLFRLIDERGMKDADCYKKANVSKQVFSNIRSNPHYLPSKSTVLALAIALELDLEETKQLLERAGYAISHSALSDVIVEYFIIHKRYNIFEINQVLFEHDQKILGSR